ncbi:MAG: hypothetical protein ACLU6W_00585 [Lachnospiraceae bacterium]
MMFGCLGYPDGRRERTISLVGRFRLVEIAAVLRFFGGRMAWKNQVPAVSKTLQGNRSFPAAWECGMVERDSSAAGWPGRIKYGRFPKPFREIVRSLRPGSAEGSEGISRRQCGLGEAGMGVGWGNVGGKEGGWLNI